MATGRFPSGKGFRYALPALAGAFLAACSGSGGDQQAAPAPPPVTVATPLHQKLTEWDEFTGRFEATAAVDVRARVSGYLTAVNFADGAMVKEGDVLFVIDPRPYPGSVDRAKADLDSANATVLLASAQLDRAQALAGTPAISAAALDARVQEKGTAAAAVEQAEAALKAEQLNLDFTKVAAPISGRVSNRRIDIGNLVFGRSQPHAAHDHRHARPDLFRLRHERGRLSRLSARRGARRGSLDPRSTDGHRGASAGRDGVDASRDDEFRRQRQSTPAPARSAPGRWSSNPDLFITPGQFGRLRMPGSNEYEAMLVPDSAIVTDQSNRSRDDRRR